MKISFEKNEAESQLTVHIEGSIDTVSSGAFKEQMNAALEGIKLLILDFANVDYITSAGLRAVFDLKEQMTGRGTMFLKHLNPEVREIFETTGFNQFIDINAGSNARNAIFSKENSVDCEDCRVVKEFCISLPADTSSFDQLKEWTQSVADQVSLPTKALRKIFVALDEIFTNIAQYAYPDHKGNVDICARYDAQTKTVSFTFCDTGIPFDPLTHEDPDVGFHRVERKVGGLGIFMVKQLMDDVVYRHENGHNQLMISKHLESCVS